MKITHTSGQAFIEKHKSIFYCLRFRFTLLHLNEQIFKNSKVNNINFEKLFVSPLIRSFTILLAKIDFETLVSPSGIGCFCIHLPQAKL